MSLGETNCSQLGAALNEMFYCKMIFKNICYDTFRVTVYMFTTGSTLFS
jgi:hypothetical protein